MSTAEKDPTQGARMTAGFVTVALTLAAASAIALTAFVALR